MSLRTLLILSAVLVLAACARSAVMPLAADTIQVTTTAAPVCGATGAQNVAVRRVAIETINRGYDKFIILGAQAQSNLSGFTPIVANTSGGTTIISGGQPLTRHSQGIVAKMFKEGDPAGANAISARATLGPKWQEVVKESTATTC